MAVHSAVRSTARRIFLTISNSTIGLNSTSAFHRRAMRLEVASGPPDRSWTSSIAR